MTALLVIAKAPAAGRVKTRLCPPCTPGQAAELAAAALQDTLAAASRAARAARRLLVLDGDAGAWIPAGFDVVPQRGEGLAERLAAAFADAGGPSLLIGMDTPQVTPALLDAGLAKLDAADAVLGEAFDGGYWAIGLRRPDAAVFRDVPMSTATTAAVQRARLAALGARTASLPPLRDVDTIADAWAVAAEAPRGRFARRLAALDLKAALPADRLYGRLLATAAREVLTGAASPARVRSADGALEPLPLDRWLGAADAADAAVLEHAEPAVIDLGCGPGRHLAALRASGKPALGVDLSPVAVRLARRRGAAAIPGDVFGDVPGAGRWRTALLLDGNIGIGGAPVTLLRRTRELVAPGGGALVELDPPGAPTFRTRIRLEAPGVVSEWFGWARVGVDGIATLAGRAGLGVEETFCAGGRWLARLRRP